MTAATRDSAGAQEAGGIVVVARTDAAPDTHAPYTVHLPGFDGPLELLLHLIEKNQLEITAISLVAVTDQFISYLRTWHYPPLPRLPEPAEQPPPLVTIGEKMLEVEALLRQHGKVTLEHALRTASSRFAVVVTFLAVLEMWHQARLEGTQEGLFGPIMIAPGPQFC